ncbi:MAG TPA: DUF2628 domain-containing protein [Acetobacteraceae bacterium]|nr:DUF2628 domain-containing protein [Acetobacteraceae bacterium]
MRIYTAHLRAGAAPVLVREGFAWGAFFLGPVWLLAHRAWIAGILAFAAMIAVGALPAGEGRMALAAALMLAFGLFGNDLRRFGLSRRGFSLAHVVAAANRDAAFSRLLDARADLLPALAGRA